MRVSIETADGLTRKLTIAVPSDTFEGEFADLVTRKATEVKLPGFRPGKVPTSEVRRRFGPQLRQEVANALLKTSLEEAVREQDFALASPAEVQIVSLAAGADFEFTATFEVMPEFELADLSQLTVRAPVAEVSDADVDAMVETLRQQRVTWHAVDREAREGDRLTVDYSLSVAGERVAEGDGRSVVVGSSGLLPELDQAVRGMSAGEDRAFPATLPPAPADTGDTADEAPSDEAAAQGQPEADAEGDASTEPAPRQAIGQVTVRTVEESRLPEVDDDFYDQFDIPDAADAAGEDRGEQFRADVRERMTVELNNALRQARRQEALAVLSRNHRFALPRALVEAQVAQEQARLRQMVANVPDELPSVFVEMAEERVRVQLAINKIVATEGLAVDDQRVRDRINEGRERLRRERAGAQRHLRGREPTGGHRGVGAGRAGGRSHHRPRPGSGSGDDLRRRDERPGASGADRRAACGRCGRVGGGRRGGRGGGRRGSRTGAAAGRGGGRRSSRRGGRRRAGG